MKLIILICTISLNTVFAQKNIKKENTQRVEKSYLELPRIQVTPIKDTKNERQYELYIKLPEGYSENDDIQYPVIYYTDAMWHVEVLSGSAEYIMEKAILVGISWQKDIKEEFKKEGRVHISRYRDYSVSKSSNAEHQAKYQFGQASNHLDFIRNDVIKYVENNYQTDTANRTYFGYSLGGIFGAYILMTQPDTFKNYILGSPALQGDIPYLSELGSHAAINRKGLNVNVFVSNGTLEKELGEYAKEFVTLLENRNDESLSLQHLVIEGSHQTAFPMTGVRSVTWLSDLIKKSKSTSCTIAYASIESGNVEIYQRNTEGKSNIKSTNVKGGYLAWSPDGKKFAFYHKYDERKTWSIHTMNSDGTNRKRSTHEKNKWDNSPAWSPDGRKIVFSRAYKDTDENWQKELWIMNSDGSEQTQIKSLNGGGPYFTPDGRIVFHSENKKSWISIADIDGNNLIRLTHNEAEEQHPEVSPDGKQIVFMSDRDGNHEIYVMNINGSNQKRLTNNDFNDWYPSWSPDGSQLIFSSLRNGEKSIYIMNKDGSSVRKIISNATSPAWLKIHQ